MAVCPRDDEISVFASSEIKQLISPACSFLFDLSMNLRLNAMAEQVISHIREARHCGGHCVPGAANLYQMNSVGSL